ncbi:hypothetical protein SLA2020_136070 [Shorea laevis]
MGSFLLEKRGKRRDNGLRLAMVDADIYTQRKWRREKVTGRCPKPRSERWERRLRLVTVDPSGDRAATGARQLE